VQELQPVIGNPGWMTTLTAWRNPYSTRVPATGILGIHNVWLASPSADAAVSPQGAGAGSITISKTGTAAVSIRLADDTTATSSVNVSEEGFVPLFNMLYSNKGSLHGRITLTDAVPPSRNTVSGTSITWRKTGPSTTTDRKYATGFNFGVGNSNFLAAGGSEYIRPATSPPPLTFLWGIQDVPVGTLNARLAFTGTAVVGNPMAVPPLAPAAMLADINKSFRISGAHAVTLPLPNNAKLSLKFDAAKGSFSGTATLKDGLIAPPSRPLTFYGVVDQAGATARGWFTVVRVPVGGSLGRLPI
jgi:hypothetical protein